MRFTKAMRSMAARLLALVYLLCIVAPSVGHALSDGSKIVPCHMGESQEVGPTHGSHVHLHNEDHRGDGGELFVGLHGAATAVTANDKYHGQADNSHKALGMQCCGIACLSALPATVTEVVKPSKVTSICDVEKYTRVTDNTPTRHYRPPIL